MMGGGYKQSYAQRGGGLRGRGPIGPGNNFVGRGYGRGRDSINGRGRGRRPSPPGGILEFVMLPLILEGHQ